MNYKARQVYVNITIHKTLSSSDCWEGRTSVSAITVNWFNMSILQIRPLRSFWLRFLQALPECRSALPIKQSWLETVNWEVERGEDVGSKQFLLQDKTGFSLSLSPYSFIPPSLPHSLTLLRLAIKFNDEQNWVRNKRMEASFALTLAGTNRCLKAAMTK